MKNKLFITTAIPYVNAKPHIGFAFEAVQTDMMARYWRPKLGKENVRALTGSDENSLKNVRAAQDTGEDVEVFVERHAEEFKKLQESLNLSFDDFIRTREPRHIEGAQLLWKSCNPEDIYTKTYKGLYCVGCEQFYTPKEAPDGICPEHKTTLEEIEEENYFFKLSHYQKDLERLIESDELKITPRSRKNEVLSFVRAGLEDFSISRSKARAQNWGVPVPGDESQVMYVWFDALSNYITALDYAKGGELFNTFWNHPDVTQVHMIGKGILRFHAVYWPAMLLSAGLPLPEEIFVHGYITIEGEKISKSLGNVIDPQDLVNEYGTDAVRYYLLREIPSSGDGDYSVARMEERYAELANQLGNLVSRTAAMAIKNFDGKLDVIDANWSEQDAHLAHAIEAYDFKAYLDTVFEAVKQANEIIDREAPFKLVKTNPDDAKRVISEIAEIIRWIARSLAPAIPSASAKILAQFQEDGTVASGDVLFPRRDV